MRRLTSRCLTRASCISSTSSAVRFDNRSAASTYKSSHTGKGTTSSSASGGPMVSACAEDVGPVEQRPLTPLQKRMLAMQNVAVFSLTARAVERVKYLLSLHQPRPAAEATTTPSASSSSSSNGAPTSGDDPLLGIRIGVKKRGCSGYSYVVNYQYESTPPRKKGDARVNQEGLSVFVDGDAMFYVVGTVMDYSVTDVEEKFTFVNPNQKTQCGCAESFNV